MHLCVQQAVRILDDVLDLEKLEENMIKLELLPFDLPGLLATSCRIFQPHFKKSKSVAMNYSMSISPTVSRVFKGDPNRINQIVSNLIGNACKFTKEGSVAVNLTVNRLAEKKEGCTLPANPTSDAHTEEKWCNVVISVTDTGTGIAPEDIPLLFRPFSQSASSTRVAGGTGLGLSISDGLARAMGGHITVESTVAKGSKFVFQLRLKEEHSQAPIDRELGLRVEGQTDITAF